MATTAAKPAAPAQAQATVQVVKRISLGSVFLTRLDTFMAGRVRPGDGTYANQSLLLSLLPPAPEGMHYEVKCFRNKASIAYEEAIAQGKTPKGKRPPEWDACIELEEDYDPEA